MLPWRILCYQQIIDPESLPFPIPLHRYVRPRTFEKHLRYLHKDCHVISLDELISKIESKISILPKTVVITFDNGWVDHFITAFPLLREYNFPATFFLPTAYIGAKQLFWQDAVMFSLIALLAQGARLESLPFLLEYFPEKAADARGTENIEAPLVLASHLVNTLRMVSLEERFAVLSDLGRAVENVGGLPFFRLFLAWDEIRIMARGGMTFGSLGHSALRADEFPAEVVIDELRQSFLKLREEKIEGMKVYCYPEGAVTWEARKRLQQAGVHHSICLNQSFAADEEENLAAVLGRVPIDEGATFCTELFACRLWA